MRCRAAPRSRSSKTVEPGTDAALTEHLGQGATSYGYPDNMWTYRRITVVIERGFSVHYVLGRFRLRG
jgi:hypothetical protein